MAHDVRGHGRDILGDQPGIEPIVLGEGAAGAGELPKPVGIDASHRQAGGEQGADDAALVAAARLEPDRGDGQVRAAARSACSSLPRCWRPRSRALRQQQHVKPVLRHIDSTEALLYHPRRPFLADAGSCPGNCAGMEETTGAPSSFAALSPRRLRASSRDGGGVVNRPPSPLTMLLSRHTRRREFLACLAAVTAAWPLAARRAGARQGVPHRHGGTGLGGAKRRLSGCLPAGAGAARLRRGAQPRDRAPIGRRRR